MQGAGAVGGAVATITASLQGNKLLRNIVQESLELLAVTEYLEGGNLMVTTVTVKQDPSIRAIRTFKRI